MARPDTTLAAAVIATYESYLRAFMAGDMDGIDACVSYPLAYIGDGAVHSFGEFPLKPADLMAQTGWHDTVDMRYEVVALGDTKAHLILHSGTRVRADGSPIEDISGFYAWTLTPAGWKMFAISDVRTPR